MINPEATKYVFSGHESFPCKSLWLKKGYDFIKEGCDFNASDAIVRLGVGKNMVAAIRYWFRAFDLAEDESMTSYNLADYLFDDECGKDPYIEDSGTLWLLHFQLVSSNIASIYYLLFLHLQKERKQFDRDQAVNFVRRKMIENDKEKMFNPNTVRKDVGVLIQNYCLPRNSQSHEDYSNLLEDLHLLRQSEDTKSFVFNLEGKIQVPPDIFLFALLKSIDSHEHNISFDMLQELGLVFCMTDLEVLEMSKMLAELYPESIAYNDVAGVKQLQITNELNEKNALDHYYESII